MRIIAGELRGRRLVPVRGRMRPTSDKVREAIFHILDQSVRETWVLDLFAGTGALAFEALSRGAREAVLVEDHPAALRVLRSNIQVLALENRTRVIPAPVRVALKRLKVQAEKFGLVFLDPPYGRGLVETTLVLLEASTLLLASARVVAEHSCRENPPEGLKVLQLSDLRRYGDTCVSFYRVKGEPH